MPANTVVRRAHHERQGGLSLSAPDTAVLTVEYKVNFVAPARGERLVATMLTTIMLMPNRLGLAA